MYPAPQDYIFCTYDGLLHFCPDGKHSFQTTSVDDYLRLYSRAFEDIEYHICCKQGLAVWAMRGFLCEFSTDTSSTFTCYFKLASVQNVELTDEEIGIMNSYWVLKTL